MSTHVAALSVLSYRLNCTNASVKGILMRPLRSRSKSIVSLVAPRFATRGFATRGFAPIALPVLLAATFCASTSPAAADENRRAGVRPNITTPLNSAAAEKTATKAISETQAADFFAALSKPDVARATELLDANPALATTLDINGNPPLYFAVQSDSIELLKLLLARGADAHAGNRNSRYPMALMNSIQRGNKDMVALLLKDEVDFDLNKSDSWISGSPFFAALQDPRRDVVALLIDRGADINKTNSNGLSPLTQVVANASYGGARDVAALLIEKGAKINARDGRGITALQAAISGFGANRARGMSTHAAGLTTALFQRRRMEPLHEYSCAARNTLS